ncbi:MAG: EutP/PduV family microcompartment system protein [Propionibacteriaceae bacterium]|jgi:ethanolamine utilization protein EutP|uniref:Ras_like_GTPase n=2 Tax=Propionibacterium ruminifibrarum TaxID=1962131 RepID=A0A375HY18_9ACTN|nr:EutP/PduV family microcompartment system protein [Propionibacteriaceae bacterium]SPF67503.1 Ras_like_GTPase [Propionibacterium ruminifibrarum]
MKRLLMIGSVGCGKTTLMQRLHGREIAYEKTETINTEDNVVDTPGEYLELPFYKHALRLASFDRDLVVMLASATVAEAKFPPGFSTFFTVPSIGVVTKIDLAEQPAIDMAAAHLREAGATEIFYVSAVTGEGIPELEARLD